MPYTKPARLLAAALCLATAPALAELRVVTSIKPLSLLAQGVAPAGTSVTTLVPPGSSPHNYNMKPSQRRALADADVIFWVGPEMETFLTRLLSGDDFRDRTVSLALEEPAMAGSDEADEHDQHDHESDKHEHDDHDDHGHDDGHKDHAEHDGHEEHREHNDHAEHEEDEEDEEHKKQDSHAHGHHDHGDGEDPHIWLDPVLAGDMAKSMHDAMAQQPNADTDALARNLAQFQSRLKTTEAEIRAKLEPVHDIGLFADHNAFVRFAEHYALKLEGVLTINPELSPGARHIAKVQKQLGQSNHPCLLTEPQFNPGIWETITENLDVTFSTWDPLATDVPEGPDGYLAFQHAIADAVLECLPEHAEH